MSPTAVDLSVKTRWTIPLVVGFGDLVALLAFTVVGLLSHGVEPWLAPWHTVMVAFPFVIAWLLLAPLGTLYNVETVLSPRKTLLRTMIVWAGATVVGGGIRATPIFPGEAPIPFLLVTLGFGLLIMGSWRVGVAALLTRWVS